MRVNERALYLSGPNAVMKGEGIRLEGIVNKSVSRVVAVNNVIWWRRPRKNGAMLELSSSRS